MKAIERFEGEPLRGGNGQFTESMDTVERDAVACAMRRDGATYLKIAQALGFTHESTARLAVRRALQRIVQEPAEELRALMTDQLNFAIAEAVKILRTRHYKVYNGEIVCHKDENGNLIPVEDPGPRLAAIAELRKLNESYRRLWGLNAPVQVEVSSYEIKINGVDLEDLK